MPGEVVYRRAQHLRLRVQGAEHQQNGREIYAGQVDVRRVQHERLLRLRGRSFRHSENPDPGNDLGQDNSHELDHVPPQQKEVRPIHASVFTQSAGRFGVFRWGILVLEIV